jgi:hypothetical protein
MLQSIDVLANQRLDAVAAGVEHAPVGQRTASKDFHCRLESTYG